MILRWIGATVTALALTGCAAEPEDPLNGAWHVQTGLLDNANANYASYMDGTLIVESGEEGQRLCSLSMLSTRIAPSRG